MKYTELIGRILFSLLFIMTLMNHFSSQSIEYAAAAGVPLAALAVPLSGIIAAIGGLSILLGYKTKIGALLIVLFLLPVTFTLHNFWSVSDPMMKQIQMIMFFKNLAMIGGALILAYNGAGALSLDQKLKSSSRIFSTEPVLENVHTGFNKAV